MVITEGWGRIIVVITSSPSSNSSSSRVGESSLLLLGLREVALGSLVELVLVHRACIG